LYDAYPNPFNPTTTIAYELTNAGDVRLEVINLLGQRVSTLVDEFQQAGRHEVIWNGKDNSGSDVASGVYFYKITTASSSASKKMILVK
jgi:flagellar hook assembly protein FlgD